MNLIGRIKDGINEWQYQKLHKNVPNSGESFEEYREKVLLSGLPDCKTEISEDEAVEKYMPTGKFVTDSKTDRKSIVLGSIFGDIIGAPYEFSDMDYRGELFRSGCKFTDDTVLTIATLDSILNHIPYDVSYVKWANRHKGAGYGSAFFEWFMNENRHPYGSYGNGGAMRVTPIGALFDDPEQVIREAYRSACVTHNHLEGIKGAVVTAVCVWLARFGTKEDICRYMLIHYGNEGCSMSFSKSYKEMAKEVCTSADVTAQRSVPFSMRAFVESSSYQDFMEKIIAGGFDTDTDGAIAGGVAAGYFEDFPFDPEEKRHEYLTDEMNVLLDQIPEK